MAMPRRTHKVAGMLKRLTLLSLAAAVILGAVAEGADAAAKRKKKTPYAQQHRSANVIRQNEFTPLDKFDETEYYERRHERIPFGSPAWWKQREIEFSLP